MLQHVSTLLNRYYKKLEMPEMKLLQLAGEGARLSWSHQGGTLTVHYSKPPVLLAEVCSWGSGCRPLHWFAQ